ncbi:MAG TPA: galactose oxidase-like domain-containing protein, partial [Dehalococcoidia bacterium]|nr:galactose oxidase-like domain-containing protein [Dehalococcoidia bacterium]
MPRSAMVRVNAALLIVCALVLGTSTTSSDVSAAVTTVTFDDTTTQNQPLNGQYPSALIDWGNGAWFLSGPWGAFATRSASFAHSGLSSASFNFVQPRRLIELTAFNGGSGTSTVTLSCPGQTPKTQGVPSGAVVQIATGWDETCATVTVSSSNGWNTNFDNLKFDDGPLPNEAPEVDVGPDKSITLPVNTVSLDGTVTDDGQPDPLTQTWTGPPGVTFLNANAVDTTATLPGTGSYVLRLTAGDGDLSAWDEVTVTVNPEPTEPVLIITLPAEGEVLTDTTTVIVQYAAAGDLTEADHAHFRLDGNPTVMDIDFDGLYTFTNVPSGDHTLVGILARPNHSEIAGSEHTISFSTTTPDEESPQVQITAPSAGATVAGTVNVTAAATDNVGVVGVRFLVDGVPVGAEDTSVPHLVAWNSTTVTNGDHTLTAIARDASANETVSDPVLVTVDNGDIRAQVGEWSPVVNWPVVSVHANLLHTGKVLVWDDENPGTVPFVWDPIANTLTETEEVPAPIICAGVIAMADGRLLVAGGHIPGGGENGIEDIYIYDPVTNAWTRTGDLIDPRYYPSLVRLQDGEIGIFSGQILTDNWSPRIEIYDPQAGTTSEVPGINVIELREEEYPLVYNLPDGTVLAISPQIGAVMRFDPDAETWTAVNVTPIELGSGVQFRPGMFLMSGGAPNFGAPASNAAAILDMTSGSPQWVATTPMTTGRYFHQLLMLPTGDVFAVGGATSASIYSTSPVLQPEIWNPVTETWTVVATQTAPRMYHSTSLLLPDGRVLTAGGGRSGPAPNQLNAQIYSPPYLFRGPRPVITDAPSVAPLGSAFTLDVADADEIASVTLVELGNATHSTFASQHFIELSFAANGDELTVDAPADVSELPPGYYMVFAVNADGVPSEASIIQFVQSQVLTSVEVAPQTASVPAGGTRTFTATALDQFGEPMVTQPPMTWSVTGGGTIDAAGVFSAGAVPGGPYVVSANTGALEATANVTVTAPDSLPTVAQAAAAVPNPSSGTTSALSVLGADDGGEATLLYTWSMASGPPSGSASFSA